MFQCSSSVTSFTSFLSVQLQMQPGCVTDWAACCLTHLQGHPGGMQQLLNFVLLCIKVLHLKEFKNNMLFHQYFHFVVPMFHSNPFLQVFLFFCTIFSLLICFLFCPSCFLTSPHLLTAHFFSVPVLHLFPKVSLMLDCKHVAQNCSLRPFDFQVIAIMMLAGLLMSCLFKSLPKVALDI